jgi:hypothetical protein
MVVQIGADDKSADRGGTGHGGPESGSPDIQTGKSSSFQLALHGNLDNEQV